MSCRYNYDYCTSGNECSNFCKNAVDLYFKYWLSKSSIVKSDGILTDKFFIRLNTAGMIEGLVPVVLNYGSGITLSKAVTTYYDKNYEPAIALVEVRDINNSINQFYVADYKLFDKPEILNQYLQARAVDGGKILKAIFFQNNYEYTPSLVNLDKIIHNIHDLDVKANDNRKNYSVLSITESEKKYTGEQLDNFSATYSNDGKAMHITTLENNRFNETGNKLVNGSILVWDQIEPEFYFWLEQFFEFGGIAKEKISTDRENLVETNARIKTVSALEKDYQRTRQWFIDEYNNYAKSNVEITFDTLALGVTVEKLIGGENNGVNE